MPIEAVLTALSVIGLASIVLLSAWSAVFAWRLLFPEKPLPFFSDPSLKRRDLARRGVSVRVGLREILEDMPEHGKCVVVPSSRAAGGGRRDATTHPDHTPAGLWERRN
jgi:hypothetical protein